MPEANEAARPTRVGDASYLLLGLGLAIVLLAALAALGIGMGVADAQSLSHMAPPQHNSRVN